MHRRNIFFLGAFVFTGIGVSACALLGAAPSIAAPLDTGLKLAAVTPSPETEQQREARLIEGAKREGKVVYWDTASNLESVFTKFRQKYPFLVMEYWKSTDEAIYQKIPAEARAGVHNFDVAGVEINFLAELRKTGLMKKYDWPNAKEWSPEHKGRDGSWVARSLNCVAAAYNTNLVSGVEAPKSWDDLLDPKWKGLMSMGKDDTDLVLMLWAAWGKEKTVNYLKALARNALQYSFLPGESLWQRYDSLEIAEACAGTLPQSSAPSATCAALLASSDRAREQWRLEAELAAFEALDWTP